MSKAILISFFINLLRIFVSSNRLSFSQLKRNFSEQYRNRQLNEDQKKTRINVYSNREKSEDFYFKTFLKSGILSELDDKTKSNKTFALAHVHTRQIEVIFRLF